MKNAEQFGTGERSRHTADVKILYEIKNVEEVRAVTMKGEYGTGGRPLKKGNPYLEVDLIDPTDPVLYEGEI